MTALKAQITPDPTATNIANETASDEADWARDEATRNGAHSRVRRPSGCVRGRGRGDDSGNGRDYRKSTKRSH